MNTNFTELAKQIKALTKSKLNIKHLEVLSSMLVSNIQDQLKDKENKISHYQKSYDLFTITAYVDGNSILLGGDYGTHYLMSLEVFNDRFAHVSTVLY